MDFWETGSRDRTGSVADLLKYFGFGSRLRDSLTRKETKCLRAFTITPDKRTGKKSAS
jgi:hypothetical protein